MKLDKAIKGIEDLLDWQKRGLSLKDKKSLTLGKEALKAIVTCRALGLKGATMHLPGETDE